MSRHPQDFYPTPANIIEALLSRLDWEGRVWEPCAGDGRLVEALEKRGFETVSGDIQSGQDFFSIQSACADTLITNPPFKVIRPFIDRAFDIGVQRMALVCPERLWACQKGYEQWVRHKPSRFVNLTWREDYLGKGGAPDRALAISIWDKPISDRCSFEIWSKPDL